MKNVEEAIASVKRLMNSSLQADPSDLNVLTDELARLRGELEACKAKLYAAEAENVRRTFLRTIGKWKDQ